MFLKTNILKFIRRQLIYILVLSFYFLSIYFFFINGKILLALNFSLLLFMLIHFFLIEFDITISVLVYGILFFTIVNLLSTFGRNVFYFFGIIIFHIGLLLLILIIYEEIHNRVTINTWRIFTSGSRIFALILSIVFSLSFLGTYKTFNLTCSKIYSFLETKKGLLTNYLNINTLEINKNTKFKNLIENLTGSTYGFTGFKFSYLGNINFWKLVVVNQIMENKKILDKNVCEIIISNIKVKYTKPGFQFAVMFLMFMLFYPLFRLVVFCLSILNWLLFKIASFFNLYKFGKKIDEIEIIE